ncbi:hypothetical protein ABBQ38_002271 [Trebouxia sp. C0009 RCD-2024]
MLERISARFSRKHIKSTSATPLRTEAFGKVFEPADRLVPPSWLTERSGEVKTASASQLEQARIEYSMVGYQAFDPYGDAHIFEVDRTGSAKHLFAAVISAKRTAQGGNFLRRNMHRELLQQIGAVGDVHKAIRATIFSLDRTWRDMHSFNRNVLDGVSLSAAYIDLSTNTLYLASTGGCRVIVGSRNHQGEVQVIADVGKAAAQSSSSPRSLSSGIATVQLEEAVDTIVLGSEGLWRDVSAHNALLRMQHYHASVPDASIGNAAAHLTNYALHNVTQRTTRMRDPRMRAIRHVSQLQSLWAGDVGNYKWGGRQPVRRRRGDVHGDMTSVVLHLNWPGKHQGLSKAGVVHKRERMGLSSNAMPKSASTTTLSAIGSRAQANWELIRMHFLDFPKEAKQHIRQQWYSAVDGVMTQRQEAKQMEFQIQGRTPHNRHASGLQFANTLVDVNA